MAQFNYFETSLLTPCFDTPWVDVLTELELLRYLWLATGVHSILFAQLKAVFHTTVQFMPAFIQLRRWHNGDKPNNGQFVPVVLFRCKL